jgi:excisionase family DNA binding protein
MTVQDAARITGYSTRTIRRACASGELPATGSERRRDITHDDLVKWCKTHNTKVGRPKVANLSVAV